MILRMTRRQSHRSSQLNRRADERLSVVVHQSAMFEGLRSMPCPGAPAECALRWPWRRTEGVPCGTDVMKSTYACAISASTLFECSTSPRPSRSRQTCRAEASSTPEGPAVGRVGAKRRAFAPVTFCPPQ
jgi:hypothetical protein